jgi:hypothetical protein
VLDYGGNILRHGPVPATAELAAKVGGEFDRIVKYTLDEKPHSVSEYFDNDETFRNGSLQVNKQLARDFGLSESDGMPMMREFNARHPSPWSDARLTYKMNQTLQASHDLPRGHKLEERQTLQTHNVDLSEFHIASVADNNSIANNDLDNEFESHEKLLEVPPIPNELLRVPGFIGEVMDFCLENSSYPIPAMAFGGALALQSFLCGRKIREPGDLRTNLYLLALANASSGKDYARKVIKAVAREIGASYGIGDKFASGQAIEDSLLLNPNLLFLSDEFDAILSSIKKGKDTSAEMIVSTLLTLYTSANTYL